MSVAEPVGAASGAVGQEHLAGAGELSDPTEYELALVGGAGRRPREDADF